MDDNIACTYVIAIEHVILTVSKELLYMTHTINTKTSDITIFESDLKRYPHSSILFETIFNDHFCCLVVNGIDWAIAWK